VQSFVYRDKGTLATIGRAAAVGDFGKIHISGFVAWMAWLFVHIYFLIGFRNRLAVMFDWAFSYLTYERAVRLITGTAEMPTKRETELASFEVTQPEGPQAA
jgi:NADH dehydrogenase